MRIFFIGDIYGRSGRDAIKTHLPQLRAELSPDLVIANVDNATHGLGINPPTARELTEYGIDIMTGGDHVWSQREMITHLDREPFVLRPLNMPEGTPGKGSHIVRLNNGKRVLVAHVLGRVFLGQLCDDPFAAMDKLLAKQTMGRDVDAVIVDFHAEATSEKNALGLHLDGLVSAVIGTHTHIPTADARIFANGTAYLTDAGMTGDYNGVIGADSKTPLQHFRTGLRHERMKPAEGEGTLCGVMIDIDDTTGKATAITPLRRGGALPPL